MAITRQHFTLTPGEQSEFNYLRPIPGEALAFWGRVAFDRGLNPKTIIADHRGFSGLPLSHKKHWCFPMPLHCSRRPTFAIVDATHSHRRTPT